jgi:oligopeptidase B
MAPMRALWIVLALPAAAASPPVAPRHTQLSELHGDKRRDDYAWLRKKGTPEVTRYLQAENAYTDAVMRPLEPLRATLATEIVARIQEKDLSVPARDGGYFYYTKHDEGKQYPAYARKKGSLDAPEEVFLDVNQLADGQKFTAVGTPITSDDGGALLYRVDHTGTRQYTLHVRDLATGNDGPEAIAHVRSMEWAKDGKTFFYVVDDDARRPYRVYRHTAGATGDDALVFEETDERFAVWVDRTRSRDFVLVSSTSLTTSEVRLIPADKPDAAPRLVAPRVDGREYYVDHRGDLLYILDNGGGRRTFRVVTAPVADPRETAWTEIVPCDPAVMLSGIDVFADFYVVRERRAGLPRLRIVDARTGQSRQVDFPEPSYAIRSQPNREFHTGEFRFEYSSPITPPTVYGVDAATGVKKYLKEIPVPGGYDRTRYTVERLSARAPDGAEVPITLVHRNGTQLPAPMLLDGYGAYGVSYDLAFDEAVPSLLDRGVIYAVAHVRGGGELGKRWHDEGRMKYKMNTFTDFIACAEVLVAKGWTKPQRLAIHGASAGGLLVGAVTNLRPDLFRAVVADAPFVDVLNTMLDESLPFTVGEFEEWGNPKNKDEYDLIKQYSPYDNVAAKEYPAMLVQSSLNDSAVMYFEPAKWVAKLRAAKTDRNPLLLRMRMEPAGHGGFSGRFDRARDRALPYAFILWQLDAATP